MMTSTEPLFVVLASIINGLKLTGKTPSGCKVVLNGSGAAGIAIAKLLLNYGFTNVILCDRKGMINKSNANNPVKREMAEFYESHSAVRLSFRCTERR